MEHLLEIITIFIAALAALLSYFSSREARKSSEKSSDAALSLAKMELDLQTKDLKLQYHNEVRSWAASSIECMGDLIALCYLSPDKCDFNFRDRQLVLVNKVSSLIDCGRWFFPNDKDTVFGLHKDEAFQGYRHESLDQLVGAFRSGITINYESGEGNIQKAKEIESRKRRFTSIVQKYIQTEEWVSVIEQIDTRSSPNNSIQPNANASAD